MLADDTIRDAEENILERERDDHRDGDIPGKKMFIGLGFSTGHFPEHNSFGTTFQLSEKKSRHFVNRPMKLFAWCVSLS